MHPKLVFELDQRPQFTEFCWYDNYFSIQELETLNALWGQLPTEDAFVTGNEAKNDDYRKSKLSFITPDIPELQWFYQKLSSLAMACNNERYLYDIHGFYEPLQLAEYSKEDFFEWHMDFGPGHVSSRKLSMSIQLTPPEEYEGGDLELMINNKATKAPRSFGTVVIFPSFILHRVTPVTSGKRRSIVGWVTGPPYK